VPQRTTTGEQWWRLDLDGAPGEPLEGVDLAWVRNHAAVGVCALQLGVAERALRMTAAYTTGREQFGKPIAAFQAVAQRAADAYIAVEAIRVTTWQAAWRLAEELPADDEVAIAKFWASDGAQQVLRGGQHLHGGIGVDVDYPLHRYTLRAKQLELMLGSGTRQLVALGERMAEL
jgi:3-oxocholest-4-en-26-oyl-CoA dehydrogenase beta subunit